MRYLCCVLVLYLTSTGLLASTTEQALSHCAKQQNNSKRLACYDQITLDLGLNAPQVKNSSQVHTSETKSQLASKPEAGMTDQMLAAEQPQLAPVVMTQKQKPQQAHDQASNKNPEFGLEHEKKREEDDKKLYSQVVDIAKNSYKKLTITLSNEQEWKQVDSASLKLSAGDTVYIERGSFNAFFLSKDDTNRRLRVKRVK